MADCVALKIEDYHLPKNFNNQIVQQTEEATVIRCNLKNMDDVKEWVKDFSKLSFTQWISRNSRPKGERFVCWKKFVCHHSSYNKGQGNLRGSKCLNCNASLIIKVKVNNRNTRYIDPFVKLDQCGVIVVKNRHSHSLMTAESLRFLSPDEQTKDKFRLYFLMGMGVKDSCRYHEHILENEECTEAELSSGRTNPTKRKVRHWFDQWRHLNLIEREERAIQEMEEKYLTSSPYFINLTDIRSSSKDKVDSSSRICPSTVEEVNQTFLNDYNTNTCEHLVKKEPKNHIESVASNVEEANKTLLIEYNTSACEHFVKKESDNHVESVVSNEDQYDIVGRTIASEIRQITDKEIYIETILAIEGIIMDAKRRQNMTL